MWWLANRAVSILVLTFRKCGSTAHKNAAALAAPPNTCGCCDCGGFSSGCECPPHPRAPLRSGTAAKQQPRARAPLPSAPPAQVPRRALRLGAAALHMRVDEDANTRAHASTRRRAARRTAAGVEMQQRGDRAGAGSTPPEAASPNHTCVMRACALVMRVRASDTTSRASPTTRPALFRPLPFAAAMATQIRRCDCNQPGRAVGSTTPTGLARPSAAREPEPAVVLRRTSLLSLMNGAQKNQLSVTSAIGASGRSGNGVQDPPKPPGPASGVRTGPAGPSLARGGHLSCARGPGFAAALVSLAKSR